MDILSDVNLVGNLKVNGFLNFGEDSLYHILLKNKPFVRFVNDNTVFENNVSVSRGTFSSVNFYDLCYDVMFLKNPYISVSDSTPNVYRHRIVPEIHRISVPSGCTKFLIGNYHISGNFEEHPYSDFNTYPLVNAWSNGSKVELDLDIIQENVSTCGLDENIIGTVSACSSDRVINVTMLASMLAE